MTTVAWDGRVLAADGRGVADEVVRTARAEKICLVRRRVGASLWGGGEEIVTLAAAAGVRHEAEEYFAWMRETGGDPDAEWPFPDWEEGKWESDCAEIRLTAAGELISVLGRSPRGKLIIFGDPGVLTQPFAMGSGYQFAEGAMAAGAGAIEAVRIAARLDLGTGGQIRYVDTLHLEQGIVTDE